MDTMTQTEALQVIDRGSLSEWVPSQHSHVGVSWVKHGFMVSGGFMVDMGSKWVFTCVTAHFILTYCRPQSHICPTFNVHPRWVSCSTPQIKVL